MNYQYPNVQRVVDELYQSDNTETELNRLIVFIEGSPQDLDDSNQDIRLLRRDVLTGLYDPRLNKCVI